MSNHYHLIMRSVHGNLSQAMRHLGGRYTQRLNRSMGWDGAIFRGRFNSQLVTRETWLRYLLAYVHLNPVRTHLIGRARDARWTSHAAYIGLDATPVWLTTDHMLALFGSGGEIERFVEDLHLGREHWPEDMSVARGWFRTPAGDEHSPMSTRAAAMAPLVDHGEALRMICGLTGATPEYLRKQVRGRRGNPARRFATWALAQSTGLTRGQIGRLLDMSPALVAKTLRRLKESKSEQVHTWCDRWSEMLASRKG